MASGGAAGRLRRSRHCGAEPGAGRIGDRGGAPIRHQQRAAVYMAACVAGGAACSRDAHRGAVCPCRVEGDADSGARVSESCPRSAVARFRSCWPTRQPNRRGGSRSCWRMARRCGWTHTSRGSLAPRAGGPARMISLPSGARVWLACGRTDMRKYAERIVMRSWPRRHHSGACF